MVIGTMSEAIDGHLCFSIIEKDIDDFLYKNNIPHDKEVRYPNSLMRADWELLVGKEKVFVEYFGLMNNPDYAAKTRRKIEIAKQNNILLIQLFPNEDWKQRILSLSLAKDAKNAKPIQLSKKS
jgi:predicted nuclease of restriction endonuclease-like RecB superfamily